MALSTRFLDDGKATLKLNALQLKNIACVNEKIEKHQYEFEHVDCATCGGENFEGVSEKDRYGFKMDVVVCKDCGLVQTNPRMNQKAYNEFYNTEYRSIYIGTEKPTEDFFNRQRFNLGKKIYDFISIHSKIGEVRNKFVFEIGCGAGGILKYFQDKGCRVKGIDLGEEYLQYGRTHHNLDLEVGSLEDFVPRLQDKPDIIIYSHVLEHILDLRTQFQQLRKIMHTETLLYIEVPGLRNLHQSYENDLLEYLQNAHVYHFTKTSLTNLMFQNGFEPIVCNEFVRSIFKISKGAGKPVICEYPAITSYLRKIEMIRKIFPIPPYRMKQQSKVVIYNMLAFFRIVPNLRQNKKWNYEVVN